MQNYCTNQSKVKADLHAVQLSEARRWSVLSINVKTVQNKVLILFHSSYIPYDCELRNLLNGRHLESGISPHS